MIDLLIPSRGRPEDALLAATSAIRNCIDSKTKIMVVIDDNDPKYNQYATDATELGYGLAIAPASERRGIVDPLNFAATFAANQPGVEYIGFMGDDHRIRTQGWDDLVLRHHPTAIVYGDDLFQSQALPTAGFILSSVVKRLGFMAPPALQHLYVDNYWKLLGERLSSIVYDPELVIEHLHPDIPDGKGGRKGTYDDLKIMLNSQETYTRDRVAFQQYVAGGSLDRDARKVHDAGD